MSKKHRPAARFTVFNAGTQPQRRAPHYAPWTSLLAGSLNAGFDIATRLLLDVGDANMERRATGSRAAAAGRAGPGDVNHIHCMAGVPGRALPSEATAGDTFPCD